MDEFMRLVEKSERVGRLCVGSQYVEARDEITAETTRDAAFVALMAMLWLFTHGHDGMAIVLTTYMEPFPPVPGGDAETEKVSECEK